MPKLVIALVVVGAVVAILIVKAIRGVETAQYESERPFGEGI